MSAVKQSSSGIKLVFFNNCFEDDFSKGERSANLDNGDFTLVNAFDRLKRIFFLLCHFYLIGRDLLCYVITEEIWKVARYTSAAPLYFSSKDGYLDGGLLADNPTEDALTAIQNFYRKREMQIPISLVVSLGSGIPPIKNQKVVDVTTDLWNVPSRVFPFLKIVGEAVSNNIMAVSNS